jgi:hypothetical protein
MADIRDIVAAIKNLDIQGDYDVGGSSDQQHGRGNLSKKITMAKLRDSLGLEGELSVTPRVGASFRSGRDGSHANIDREATGLGVNYKSKSGMTDIGADVNRNKEYRLGIQHRFNEGGFVKSSASSRADGIAQRGKTKGRII